MKTFSTAALLILGLVLLYASALGDRSGEERKVARRQARLLKIFDAMPDSELSAMNPSFAESARTWVAHQTSFTDEVKNLSKRKFNMSKVNRIFRQWGKYCLCMVENADNMGSKTESVCWKRRSRKRPIRRLLKSAKLGKRRFSEKKKHIFRNRSSHRALSFYKSKLDNASVHASIIDIPGYFPDNDDFFDAATCRASRRTSLFERLSCEALGAAAFVGVQAVALGLGIVDLVDTEPSVPVPDIIREQMGCAFGPELEDVRLTFNARDPISVIIDGIVQLVNPDFPPSTPNTNDLIDATAFANKIRLERSMEVLLAQPSGRALLRHELYHVLQWKNQGEQGGANLQTPSGRLFATSLMGFAAAREFCLADFKYPCNAAECDGYYCQSIDLCSNAQVLNEMCATSDFDAPSVDPREF